MVYFVRYLSGEHEQVWDELRSLGPAALKDPYGADTRRVAVETLERATANLTRLAEGLIALGYEFVSVTPAPLDAGAVNGAVQASAAEALLSHPGLSREQVEQMLASLPQLLGGLAGSSFQGTTSAPSITPRASPFCTLPEHDRLIDAFERSAGPLPLSVREFWRRTRGVDFNCRNAQGELHLDALAVLSTATLLDDYEQWGIEGDGHPFRAELVAAAGVDEPPIHAEMSPGVDALLETGEWFVDYLRRLVRSACLGVEPEQLPPEVRALAEDCTRF